MSDNRNVSTAFSANGSSTVCIDTHKVFDSCRDRDCFENSRVYLTPLGEKTLESATNIRARSAKVICAFIGVSEVPFNCGFYQVTIRYYILIELEACLGIGRSQEFYGISVLEKNVILYGGEGSVTTFSSDPTNRFCGCNMKNSGSSDPVAIAETVEPIVLGTKIVECGCQNEVSELIDIPDNVRELINDDIVTCSQGPRLYASYGIFSVIRIVRPTQILVQATDYSVPDKECTEAQNDEDPCSVFASISFPTARFRANGCSCENEREGNRPQRNCGCSDRRR